MNHSHYLLHFGRREDDHRGAVHGLIELDHFFAKEVRVVLDGVGLVVWSSMSATHCCCSLLRVRFSDVDLFSRLIAEQGTDTEQRENCHHRYEDTSLKFSEWKTTPGNPEKSLQ